MPLIPTVMPDEKVDNTNNLGSPGIQIPQNAKDIKEFQEVRNVDAKDLNAKLQAQDEAKTQSTPGVQIPKNPTDISAFTDISKEDPKALNDRLQK